MVTFRAQPAADLKELFPDKLNHKLINHHKVGMPYSLRLDSRSSRVIDRFFHKLSRRTPFGQREILTTAILPNFPLWDC